jgi:23S rRNA pseudouridine1911/1915/1917 synthase
MKEISCLSPGHERLDKLLAALTEADLSRSRIQDLIRQGQVRVEGQICRDPAVKPQAGAQVRLDVPDAIPMDLVGEAIALTICFEDEHLIVIDKPAGLVVHPSAGHETGTLVHALIAHCGSRLSGIGGVQRPGIVHRLDKDTSGLMVVAKTDKAHQGLAAQFADHGRSGPLERVYHALVWGVPSPANGTIDAPLARHPHHREKIAVTRRADARFALTHYAVHEIFSHQKPAIASRVECRLETGRTHQIRVHMAHRGHPLLGDSLYGSGFGTKAQLLSRAAGEALGVLGRQALHAIVLGFEHPATGQELYFESTAPQDWQALIEALREG